ncbi:MAG TPA: DUF1570 domain-containing protein, partial [Candidatus Eisenbacteria bacterium]
IVVSNCSESRVRDLARGLEQFFAVVDRSWGGTVPVGQADGKRRIYIFASHAEFQSILSMSPRYGRRSKVRGLFLRDGDDVTLLVDAGNTPWPLGTLQHELVHDLLAARSMHVPLWFNEGLAEYYSNFLTGPKEVQIGRPLVDHLEYMQQAPWLDMDELFQVDHDSPHYNEGSKAGTFYAQSYALVHYLLVGRPGMTPSWRPYVEALDRGQDQAKAFEEAFALDQRGLNEELAAYVARDSWPSKRIKISDLKLPKERKPISLNPTRALVRIGDLVHRMDEDDGNVQETRAWYEEALRRTPGDAGAMAALAALAEYKAPERPSFPPDQPEPSVNDPNKKPRYLSDGAVADAFDAINSMIQSQQLEEAAEAIEALIPRCPNPRDQDTLRLKLSSLKPTIAHNKRVDAYNAAVRALNEGRRTDARRILDGITGPGTDKELEAAIRKLRATVEGLEP